MSDSLLTPAEAIETARATLDELCAGDPDTARVILHLPPDGAIAYSEHDVARMARIGLASRAVEVRCTRGCQHSKRTAILDRGVDCCMACRFQFADAKARGDGRCDTCNAEAKELELEQVKCQLHGNIILPDGGRQASVLVHAKVCADCLALLESAPSTSPAASWN